jgi:hypothetical protein
LGDRLGEASTPLTYPSPLVAVVVTIAVRIMLVARKWMLDEGDGVTVGLLAYWYPIRTPIKAPTFSSTSFTGSDFHLFSQNLPKIDGI